MKLIKMSEKLGISITTISRVLTNDPNIKVKESTKNKIIEFALENGYEFKNKENKKEVLIITSYNKETEIEDPYYKELRILLEKELIKNNFKYKNIEYNNKIKFNKYNILIGHFNKNQLKDISNNNKINILCDSYTNEENIDCISFDYKHSVYNVLNVFIKRGHNKIAFIGGRDSYGSVDFREKYYKNYMIKNNKYNDKYIYVDKFNSATGYKGIKEIYKNNNPTAIFVANDTIAIGCYKALNEIGKIIGKDVSIIGFNNSDFAEFMTPQLSSVQLFINNIVKETIALLIEHITLKRKYSKKVTLSTKLVKRESLF